MQKSMKERGFTLIELLIVIVIIGILAGVVISIINPARQQNRAKDANVQAALNKAALAIQGYNSAYGTYPDGLNVLQSLTNATAMDANTCLPSGDTCAYRFQSGATPIQNLDLPMLCNTTGYLAGTAQCYYVYNRLPLAGPTYTSFVIYAKSFGSTGLFRYNSANSKIETCDTAGANCI